MVTSVENNKLEKKPVDPSSQNVVSRHLGRFYVWLHNNVYHPVASQVWHPVHTTAELFKTTNGVEKVLKVAIVFFDAFTMGFVGVAAIDAARGAFKGVVEVVGAINVFQRPKDFFARDSVTEPQHVHDPARKGSYIHQKGTPFRIAKFVSLTIGQALLTIIFVTKMALKGVADVFMGISAYCSVIESSVEIGLTKQKLKAYRFADEKNLSDKDKKAIADAHHKLKKCWLDIANNIGKIACIILGIYIGGYAGFLLIVGFTAITALWKTIHELKTPALSSGPIAAT
jgi:hypothetical protein